MLIVKEIKSLKEREKIHNNILLQGKVVIPLQSKVVILLQSSNPSTNCTIKNKNIRNRN